MRSTRRRGWHERLRPAVPDRLRGRPGRGTRARLRARRRGPADRVRARRRVRRAHVAAAAGLPERRVHRRRVGRAGGGPLVRRAGGLQPRRLRRLPGRSDGGAGAGPAHVAGLSWGGTVALELYRNHPQCVATLILADTYAGWKGSLPEAEVRARLEAYREMVASDDRRFEPTLPGLFAGRPAEEVRALMAEMAADVRPQSMSTVLEIMAEADLSDLLPHIAVPALLVWGEQDARSPLTVARQFERAIPDTTLVTIPGAGHVSNLECAERFDEAVRAFCRAATSEPPPARRPPRPGRAPRP